MDQGDLLLNKHLTLKNMLHVTKLFTNLMSIQKLILNTNCSVIFYSTHYEIQKQGTKKRIGFAKARAGLFYLEGLSEQDKQGQIPLVLCLA